MDEVLKRLISNLVDTFILVLLVMLYWLHILSWPLIGQAVFMHSGQTTQEINPKFVRYIHYSTPHPWLNCGLAPLNFHLLASDWSNSFCQFANEPLIRLSSNLLGQIIMGCWSTFSHTSLNFFHFLASDWSSSFHSFAEQGKSEGFESCYRPIVRKRPIWVKIGDVLYRVTLKFDGWPRKTTEHLSFAVSSFMQHFVAIGTFKL